MKERGDKKRCKYKQEWHRQTVGILCRQSMSRVRPVMNFLLSGLICSVRNKTVGMIGQDLLLWKHKLSCPITCTGWCLN